MAENSILSTCRAAAVRGEELGKSCCSSLGSWERKATLICNRFIPQLGMGQGELVTCASELLSPAASRKTALCIASVFLSLLHPLPLLPRFRASLDKLQLPCPKLLLWREPCARLTCVHGSHSGAVFLLSPHNTPGTLLLLNQTLLPLSQTTDSRQGLQTELEIKGLVL